VTEAEVRSAAVRLEQFRETFQGLFPKMRFDTKVPINVLIFRDAESYRPFRPRRPDGTPDETVAGYFLAGEAVNYITLAMRGGKSDPYHTIFHEYVHFLLKSNTGRNDLPAWLGEGLAQYFETMRLAADGTAVIGEPPQGRLVTLRQGAMLPWRELFTTERSSLHGTADVSRSMFYAQSWLLVHYLMHNGPAASQNRLDRFLGLPDRSDSVEAALRDAFALGPADLDSLLSAYLRLPTLPVTTAKLNSVQPAFVEKESTRISNAQVNAYMGDLLLHMNRMDDAEPHLRAAIAADSDLAPAHASLGFLLIRRDRAVDALRHLEIAVTKGPASYFDYFNYAYALSRTSGTGGMVSHIPALTAENIRRSLRRSMEMEPSYPENYRLLAFLNFINDDDVDEAASLLEKGLLLRPGDQNFEMLLARIMLKQERFDEARRLAERLSREARDAKIREEAGEVLSSLTQFTRAKLQITASGASNRALPWSPTMVLLKRSWVTEADIAAVEKIREMANLNRLLEPRRPGEERILGTIEQIDCYRGVIIYSVKSGGELLRFTGERFDGVRMGVLVSGQHAFRIDCGVKLPSNPVVLMYVSAGKRPGESPRLTSMTFVPDNFELWSPEQLAASRTVVIEDDLVRRSTETAGGFVRELPGTAARWAAIAKTLRKVVDGERRLTGTLEAVECSQTGYTAVATVDGKKVRFAADTSLVPTWFSVDASQAPLACGARPQIQNVLFTFRSNDASGDTEPRLKAMEFLPDGFPVEMITGPAR
jgi:tetratricopeptide (TPR) repeat protein